jgi:hypothetical protein
LPVSLDLNKYTVQGVASTMKLLPFQGVTFNCVNSASLALWLNGIPNIGIHPYFLYATTYFYTHGARIDLMSYYFNNQNNK